MSEKILTAHNLKYEWRTNDIFSNEPNRILWQIPSLEINAPAPLPVGTHAPITRRD